LNEITCEGIEFDRTVRFFPSLRTMVKGYDVTGRTKRMGQGEGMWWMGLRGDRVPGAMRTKVGALF